MTNQKFYTVSHFDDGKLTR